jgi:predicted RNA-binding protein with PUA-like domain
MNYWLVKQEPESYSWSDFLRDGRTAWTGVRNYQARNNLRAMAQGDLVFFYHSVSEKQIVGLAKVAKAAYPDPTAEEEGWLCVDLVPDRPLSHPVTLVKIKADPLLKAMPLLRNSRLSVTPVTKAQYAHLLQLANEKLKPRSQT